MRFEYLLEDLLAHVLESLGMHFEILFEMPLDIPIGMPFEIPLEILLETPFEIHLEIPFEPPLEIHLEILP